MFRSDVKLKAIHSPDISVALRHRRSSIPPANMEMGACIATRNVYRLYVEGQDPYMFALPAAESGESNSGSRLSAPESLPAM
jgi:hypothetical protein